jgi:hypothetical protein
MIRRDVPAKGDSQAQWALIAQVEHARLSGELAEQWGAAPFEPLVPRDELLWAIAHHDDGWLAWDAAPQVDPQTGMPRSFTEMEIDDSIAIWTGSIEGAAARGPLAGYVVAGHFAALARRAAPWKRADSAWPRAEQFIARCETQMRDWLARWQVADPPSRSELVAQRALSQLQFFDSLSLWFCTFEATDPETVQTPGGVELTLRPEGRGRVQFEPWPFQIPQAEFEVSGRCIAAARYADAAALASAPSKSVQLHWLVHP